MIAPGPGHDREKGESMMSSESNENRLARLASRARDLVRVSTTLPLEAIDFLGRPALGRRRRPPSGAAPGEMIVPEDAPAPQIHGISYGPEMLEEFVIDHVEACRERLTVPGRVVWLDVQGFGSQEILQTLGECLGIHPLAMADVVHVPQRPKVELYDDRLLVITQMARVNDEDEIVIEQVSLVLGPGWVVSFQERPGDVFDPIRNRIHVQTSRIRRMGPDFLLYALIDAVIDGYFPVVERLGDIVETLEEEIIERPDVSTLTRLHATRRTLLMLHRVQWRQRDAVNSMLRDEGLPIGDELKPYLRDAHDHAFQTLDAIDTYREMVGGLMDLQLSSASYRMNEVMKTLTIVATIFIPLTFVVGVYGMNFDHMPELHWRWGYGATWAVMIAIAAGLLGWFRYRGWLGGESDRKR